MARRTATARKSDPDACPPTLRSSPCPTLPESGPRTAPGGQYEGLAVLQAYAALKAAEKAYKALSAPYLARLMREGLDGETFPGMGTTATVGASWRDCPDLDAVRAHYEAQGLTLPTKRTAVKESLRCNVNV